MKISCRISVFCFVFLNLLLLISCSKEEKPYNPPIISISMPGANARFQAFDTMRVQASIVDNERIEIVSVTIKGEAHSPVLRLPDIYPNAANYSLLIDFQLNKADLNGRHYLEITARDKDNFVSAYQFIQISSEPLRLDSVFVITTSVNTIEINSLNGDKLTVLAAYNGDFMTSAIDRDAMRLYTIGSIDGDLNAHSLSNGELVWKYNSNTIPGVPSFNDFQYIDGICLVSLQEGKIIGMRPSGDLHMEVLMENGFLPGKIFQHKNKLIFEQVDKSTKQVQMIVREYPSGMEDKEKIFDYGRVKAIFTYSDEELLMFSNSPSGQYILLFNFIDNYFTRLDFATDGDYGAFCRVDDNTLIFVKGNKLYKYFIKQRVWILVAENYAPEVLRYNQAEGSVWCALDKEIRIFDPLNGNMIEKRILDKEVSSIEFLYSR